MTPIWYDGKCRCRGARVRRVMAAAAAGLLAVVLMACGGDDNVVASIDAVGGTVTAADGASVEVPAGALSQPTAIGIAASADGAPPLPPGTTTVSAIYALTPHGTTFAVPVTVTLPFDPAKLPAGATVGVLKSNASSSGWEPVTGATVSGNTVSTQASGFSWRVAVPSLPTITGQPVSLTVTEGQDATFGVTAQANSGPVLRYQWQRDGADIPGATGASYTLAGAGTGDNGARFAVVVDNGIGTIRSAEATLTVTPPAVAPPGVDLSGTWNSLYTCDTTDGGGFSGDELLVIAQSGLRVDFTNTTDGATGSGTLVGDTVTWSAVGPGYRESGTWRVSSPDTLIKHSTYTNDAAAGGGGGTCSGSIHKQS